ncbi:LysR family transcriptional regulator [Burkholderia sp. Bp8992]|uniref:helix-turn-helix domain-containing protein n=1 Tax=Burkholderia sp. Bp8992 TaxID=2184554 RepID=UPI000F56B96B|nr:LysR family transcriptional regulator [Burkholderia sp. Bp8992]RQS28003.1 LysR family transcriptional regulator [Burkholderia sp. Bp8992]
MKASPQPPQFNWNLLKAFVGAAQYRSITEAARAIGVHRSTLSQKIAELERVLGQPLMERRAGKDGFRLTAFGERLCALVARFDRDLTALHGNPGNAPTAFDAVDVLADVETAMEALKRAAESLRQS